MAAAALSISLAGMIVLLVALRQFWRASPQPRVPGARLTQAALLTVFLSSTLIEVTRFKGVTSLPQTLTLVLALAAAPLIFMSVRMCGVAIRLQPIVLAPAAVVALALTSNAFENNVSSASDLLMRSLLVLFWLAVGLLVSLGHLSRTQAMLLLVIQFAAACSATAFSAEAFRSCDIFKCGGFGALFTGPFSSENLMAEIAVLALLIVFAPVSRVFSTSVVLLASVVLYATVSRTSVYALCAAIAIALLCARLRKLGRPASFALAASTVIAACSYGIWAVSNAGPRDFSNRGAFWHQAWLQLDGALIFGRGLDDWRYLQEAGELPALYPHSQYLLLIFWAGFVGLAGWISFLLALLWRACKHAESSKACVALVLAISIMGVTEAFWNPLALDARTPVVIVLIALVVAPERSRQRQRRVQAVLPPSPDLTGGRDAALSSGLRVTERRTPRHGEPRESPERHYARQK